jgi:hypothetical protein
VLHPVHLHPSLIGSPLPWDVFTEAGVLVASAGLPIQDEAHFRRLIARPLYRDIAYAEAMSRGPGINLLERLETLGREIDALLTPPYGPLFSNQMGEWLRALLKNLRTDPDACLGYLRRVSLARPSVHHSLHVLMVSVLLAEQNDLPAASQFSLAGAAMTMNLAVLDIQDRMAGAPSPPDAEERARMADHPIQSAHLLIQGGVDDEDWLQAVRQHHENIDGSGYPAGLGIEALTPLARILRVADVYCAKLEGRYYRPPQSPGTALKEIFGRTRGYLDPLICAQLVHTLGLNPPGTLVRLANGERACITRRGRAGKPPAVASFLDSRDRLLLPPRPRDQGRQAYALRGYQSEETDWPPINWKLLWGYP